MASRVLCATLVFAASQPAGAQMPRWRDLPVQEVPAPGGLPLPLPLGCKVEYLQGIDSTVGNILCEYRKIAISFDIAPFADVDFGQNDETPAQPPWLRNACRSRSGERLWCRVEPGGESNTCSAEVAAGGGVKHLALFARFPLLGPATFRVCARDEDAARAALEVITGYTRASRFD